LDQRQLPIEPPVNLPPQAQLLPTEPDYLARADLSAKLEKEDYKIRLREAQVELRKLQLKIFQANIPVLVLFEGWDAAGKGGAIKRLTDTLDSSQLSSDCFCCPDGGRTSLSLPLALLAEITAAKTIGIFDRSWYGRILVERVEGFAQDMEWRRAYQEINEFEAQLTHSGCVLVKFWLHISPEEQLNRFNERQTNPYRQHKLTDEDWRNREKQPLYHVAVNHMVARTSTPVAPWTIVAANDKYFAQPLKS
jgi:polyphosphate kinase 2 (PPK2 family)